MYKNLCLQYSDSRKNFFKYKTEAAAFAEKLLKIFKEKIELVDDKDDLVKLYPEKQPFDKLLTFSPGEVVEINNSGYWRFSLMLKLEPRDSLPPEILRFNFSYKKDGNTISLSYLEKGDQAVYEQNLVNYLQNTVFPDLVTAVGEIYKKSTSLNYSNSEEIRVVVVVDKS